MDGELRVLKITNTLKSGLYIMLFLILLTELKRKA